MTTYQVRQGDLFIQKIKELPKRLKKRKTQVVLYGEVTTHSHRILDGSVYDSKDGEIYLEIPKKTQLVHDEHNAINLPKGIYKVTRQVEHYMADMVKVVVD